MRAHLSWLLLLSGGLAHAAEPPQPTEVTVRGDQEPRSASQSTKRREVIEAAPHRTGSDVLSVLPGVWVTQHSGEGKAHQIFLRGFDAVHGQDIELSVNGVPVNEVSNVHGQGYADLHFVPPELIRSLTLLPGSYDPSQGDFAVAGSVRYKLGLDLPDSRAAVAKAMLGSFGSQRLFLGYQPRQTRRDERGDTFVAYEAYRTRGFGPARAATRHSGHAGVRLRLGERSTLQVWTAAYHSRFDSAGVLLRRSVEREELGAFDTYDSKQGGDSTRISLSAELERSDAREQVRLQPYVVWRALRLRSNFTGFLNDPIAGDNVEQHNRALTVGVNSSYARTVHLVSARDRVEIGTQLRHDRIEQSQLRLAAVDDSPSRSEVDAQIGASDLAAYADARLRPLARLLVRGGLRASGLFYSAQDRLEAQPSRIAASRSTAGTVLSPRLSLDWRAVGPLHLLASYGEGFRSPQARSLSPGQSLPFTRVRSTELGARLRSGPLEASAAGFCSWLSNDLVFDPVTARNEATPGTRRAGVALDLLVQLPAALVLSSSATFTQAVFRADGAVGSSQATVRTGDWLPYAPQLVARSDLSTRRKLASPGGHPLSVHLGSGLTLLSRRPLPFGQMGRDIFLADLRAELDYRNLTLGVDVMNALGQRYYDAEFVYASRFHQGAGESLVPQRHVTVGPPRAIYGTLSLQI